MKLEIIQSAEFIQKQSSLSPQIGVVLGTGLGDLADKVKHPVVIPYESIPHFPRSTVKFHAGQLVLGNWQQKSLIIMKGRFHYYEGYPLRDVTLPIRVMHQLGVRTLILSNAAGGIRDFLPAGTLALVTDHINLMGDNPLIGPYEEFLGERFPDMSEPYNKKLRQLALECAASTGVELKEHVYSAVSGPSFETPAEIRMLQLLGADSVGMSVIPEVLVAHQLGMRVLAITAITDQALPDNMPAISHEEVSRVAKEITPKFIKLMSEIIKRI